VQVCLNPKNPAGAGTQLSNLKIITLLDEAKKVMSLTAWNYEAKLMSKPSFE